ncbi:hypothetical protein ABZ860_14890 [Microbispora sp. NPDC046973]|uniref:TlpA family protein disulfide reductase n=1 Tax=Microbispora sp. NPDC046973 TaxID=3155022 RepID=UPI0033E5A7E9
MPYLVALVVLVGVFCLVNLILIVGVIRRLREHDEALAARSEQEQNRRAILSEGEVAEPFETVSTDGGLVSRDRFEQPTLVGFFSPGCTACHEALPGFLAMAERFPGGPEQVLAVIVDENGESGAQRASLEPVARVVVEKLGGPVTSALHVGAVPAFGLVGPGGTVMSSGLRLDQVLTAASA